MDININLANNATSLEMDEVIFSQALTDINLHATETIANGVSCALLTANGKTLAHSLVSDSRAVLDTNTVECVEYVASLPIEATRGAYIVIGESEKPLAIVPAQIAKNPLADIAPPTESAPTYPTQQEFIELLAQLEAMRETVSEMQQEVIDDINDGKQLALDAISTATTDGVASVNATATEATTDINAKVTQAQASATQAQTSATSASTSATSASESATNASASATQASQFATQAESAKDATVSVKDELQEALTEASGVVDRVTDLETQGGTIHRRDVFTEAFDAVGVGSYKKSDTGLRQLITTDKGYLIGMMVYATQEVHYFALKENGELLATSLKAGYTSESNTSINNLIIETLNGVYILTSTLRVLHLVETESGASFVEEGTVDLNGIVSSLVPNCNQRRIGTLTFTEFDENGIATSVLAVINGTTVVDLVSRKVVQVLGYDLFQVTLNKAEVGDTVYVCSSNMCFTATVESGLISLAEVRTATSNNTISFIGKTSFSNFYLLDNASSADVSTISYYRSDVGTLLKTNASPYIKANRVASRDGKFIGINIGEGVVFGRAAIDGSWNTTLLTLTVERQYFVEGSGFRGFLGADDKGVWIVDKGVKKAGACIQPTNPLIRINWEDIP